MPIRPFALVVACSAEELSASERRVVEAVRHTPLEESTSTDLEHFGYTS